MLFIAGSLFGAWILSWFGFKGLVIAGMAQLFGVSITSVGYYFMFAMMGALKSVIFAFKNNSFQWGKKDKE